MEKNMKIKCHYNVLTLHLNEVKTEYSQQMSKFNCLSKIQILSLQYFYQNKKLLIRRVQLLKSFLHGKNFIPNTENILINFSL